MDDITPSPFALFSAQIVGLTQRSAPAVVSIEDHGRTFSGFHWRTDVIVTASDRLEARAGKKVALTTFQGATTSGTVIGHDPSTDVALIRADVAGAQVPERSAQPLALGEAVIALGRGTYGPTCAVGFVALAGGPWRSMRGGDIAQRVQLDLRLARDGEGGVVIDHAGQLVGMAVLGPRRRPLLIPAGTIERVSHELLAHGRIRRGYLGVSVQPVPVEQVAAGGSGEAAPDRHEPHRGLMIVTLERAGPAARAGLSQGDIITAVAGQAVHSPRALARLLGTATIGQSIGIDLLRSGAATTVTVTVGEAPAA